MMSVCRRVVRLIPAVATDELPELWKREANPRRQHTHASERKYRDSKIIHLYITDRGGGTHSKEGAGKAVRLLEAWRGSGFAR